MKKTIRNATPKTMGGIAWASYVMDYGVALLEIAAFNELYTAHMMLRERRDLYRQQAKKFANDTIELVKTKRRHMMSLMTDRTYYDTYTDKVIDLAENDITLFRISLKQTLDKAGHKDSDLISYIETARALLYASTIQFSEVMKDIRKEFDDNNNYPWESTFWEFDCKDVLHAWERLCDVLYKNNMTINLNTPDSTTLFNNLCRKFAEGDYVEPCMKEAENLT